MGYGVWPFNDHVRMISHRVLNDFAASKQVLPCMDFAEALAAAEVPGRSCEKNNRFRFFSWKMVGFLPWKMVVFTMENCCFS